jgi:hypothetical protein
MPWAAAAILILVLCATGCAHRDPLNPAVGPAGYHRLP